MDNELALSMKGINKTFPGVIALDNVDLELKKGEVLCILGENGAGKSTLLKILAGAYKKDSGSIKIDGRETDFKSPHDAIEKGISVIYQELNEIRDLTVAENIFLERQPVRGFIKKLDWNRMFAMAKEVFTQIGVEIDPKKDMNSLTVAEKQLVEIAKAISHDMKILVTDEPTSALNDHEVRKLFEVINKLKQKGVGVIFISHRLEEVMEISDRVLVLRDGRNVGILETGKTSEEELVTMMVGRKLVEMFPKKKHALGQRFFEARDINAPGLCNINLELHRGEILGICGLMGSGIHQLGYVLFGKEKYSSGEIRINDRKVNINSPEDAMKSRIAFVPSERKVDGLVLGMNLIENISLAGLAGNTKGFVLNHKEDRLKAEQWVEKFRVKTPSVFSEVKCLSGGNQQKVVLGKWLELEPEILILSEPTRGIDVGAKAEIYSFMEQFCQNGGAIILITSEMREILELSDRIIVMHDGLIRGIIGHEDANQEVLLHMAMGGN